MDKIYIIAEIGMNHDGSLGQAKMLAKAASENGANAVKFQMHISEAETLKNAPAPRYFTGEGRYEYFERTAFDFEQWLELKEYCKALKIDFIVSPFSIEAVDLLEKIGIDAIKIPSGEVTNIPYLEHISQCSSVPVILSSGMNTMQEVKCAFDILANGLRKVDVLQCTSEYPCRAEKLGLNIIEELKQIFPEARVGFSDHSDNIYSSILAVTKGAAIIERHFTLSRLMYGPDAYMSLEPTDLKELRKAVDYSQIALTSLVDKNDIREYSDMRITFQKSIVTGADLKKGDVITKEVLAYKKPGSGIPAAQYKKLLGKKINKNLRKDSIISEEDIEW